MAFIIEIEVWGNVSGEQGKAPFAQMSLRFSNKCDLRCCFHNDVKPHSHEVSKEGGRGGRGEGLVWQKAQS